MLSAIDNDALAKEQSNDENISTVLPWVQQGSTSTKEVTKGWRPAAKCLLREFSILKIENGLLKRDISLPREGVPQQLVLPKFF